MVGLVTELILLSIKTKSVDPVSHGTNKRNTAFYSVDAYIIMHAALIDQWSLFFPVALSPRSHSSSASKKYVENKIKAIES